MGTFDDLSDEEKTRALLQFLQHHQQLEQENERKQYQDGISNSASTSHFGGNHKITANCSLLLSVLLASTSSVIFKYLVNNLYREIINQRFLTSAIRT